MAYMSKHGADFKKDMWHGTAPLLASNSFRLSYPIPPHVPICQPALGIEGHQTTCTATGTLLAAAVPWPREGTLSTEWPMCDSRLAEDWPKDDSRPAEGPWEERHPACASSLAEEGPGTGVGATAVLVPAAGPSSPTRSNAAPMSCGGQAGQSLLLLQTSHAAPCKFTSTARPAERAGLGLTLPPMSTTALNQVTTHLLDPCLHLSQPLPHGCQQGVDGRQPVHPAARTGSSRPTLHHLHLWGADEGRVSSRLQTGTLCTSTSLVHSNSG